MSGLLTATELAKALSLSREWVSRHRTSPAIRQFEVRQPMGHKRYSAVLVQKFLDGESLVRIGRGSRT